MMLNKPVIVKPHFLPCIQYLTKAQASSLLMIDDEASFGKQSYQNRAYITGANKVQRLTIPLKQGKSSRAFRDIEIDYQDPWPRKFWTAIASAYGKTPYFPFYAPEVEQLLKAGYRYLLDLNLHALEVLANSLKMDLSLQLCSHQSALVHHAYDLRDLVHPRRPWQQDPAYRVIRYAQPFEERVGFQPNLCGLDLLFNEGPQGRTILKQSHVQEQHHSS